MMQFKNIFQVLQENNNMYKLIILFLLLTINTSNSENPKQDKFENFNKKYKILSFEKVIIDSTDKDCENFIINNNEAEQCLTQLVVIDNYTWNYYFNYYPCYYKGKIIYERDTLNMELYAGGYAFLTKDSKELILGCQSDSCKKYFLNIYNTSIMND